MNPALILGALLGVAVVCAVALVMRAQHRPQDMQRAAAERGMTFEPDAKPFSDEEMQQILRFTRRHGQVCNNVMRGTVGDLEAVYFEHHNRHGNGHESVAAFHVWAPVFELVPLRHAVNPAVMAPVFERLGFVVLSFADYPEFCQHYLLIGREEEALRGLFTPELRKFFCGPDAQAQWATESGGGWLLVYRADHRVRASEVGQFLDEAARVVSVVRAAVPRAAAAG